MVILRGRTDSATKPVYVPIEALWLIIFFNPTPLSLVPDCWYSIHSIMKYVLSSWVQSLFYVKEVLDSILCLLKSACQNEVTDLGFNSFP